MTNRRPIGIRIEIRDLEANAPIFRARADQDPERALRDAQRFLHQGIAGPKRQHPAPQPVPPFDESFDQQMERIENQIRANLEAPHCRSRR